MISDKARSVGFLLGFLCEVGNGGLEVGAVQWVEDLIPSILLHYTTNATYCKTFTQHLELCVKNNDRKYTAEEGVRSCRRFLARLQRFFGALSSSR